MRLGQIHQLPGGFPESPVVLIVLNIFGAVFPHHGDFQFVWHRVASTTSLPNYVTPVLLAAWITIYQHKPRRCEPPRQFLEVISAVIASNLKNIFFPRYLGRPSLNPL